MAPASEVTLGLHEQKQVRADPPRAARKAGESSDKVAGDLQRRFAAAAARKAQQPLQPRSAPSQDTAEPSVEASPGGCSSSAKPTQDDARQSLEIAMQTPLPDSDSETGEDPLNDGEATAAAGETAQLQKQTPTPARRRDADDIGVGSLQRRLLAKARGAEEAKAKAKAAAEQELRAKVEQEAEAAAQAKREADAAAKAQAAAFAAKVSALCSRVGPPEEAEAQPDGTFTLQLEDDSVLKWSKRPDGTWRKPERRRAGWVGELEQTKYTIPQARGVELASDRLAQAGRALDGVRSVSPPASEASSGPPEKAPRAKAAPSSALGPARHLVWRPVAAKKDTKIQELDPEFVAECQANGWQ